MYGLHVQRRVLKRWTITILPLWGALSDVFLFLVHKSNFGNQDKIYRSWRVLLFACHPQRLYYEPVGSALAQLQDSISLTATKIAQDGTPCTKDYFRNKEWKDGSDLCRQIEIKALSMAFRRTFDTLQFVAKANSCGDHVLAVADGPKEEGWGRYFSTVPHSNDELRRLLPPALQPIENDQGSRWNDPSDFPDAVQEWFRGQKEILFYGRCIHGMSDIAGIFKASCMPTNTELASFSLKEMFRMMMLKQILALGKANGKNQDLYHIRFDSQSIETCCHQCNSGLDDDHDSRWSTKRPGFYIAR
jgi:hypothetical protein